MRLSPISLAITRLGRTADPDAAIKALFAAGEQGVWYDPSDLTTLFQDSFGTTPVTADGQSVGLVLDKSKRLVPGSELVLNGNFATGTLANWTMSFNAAGSSVIGGELNLVISGGSGGYYQDVTVEIGKTYKVSFDIRKISGTGNVRCILYDGAAFTTTLTQSSWVTTVAPAVTTTLYVKTSLTTTIRIYLYGSTDAVGGYDNVTAKQIPGNHASQATAAACPLYKVTGLCKWNDFDAVDDVLNTTFQSALGSSCTVARGNVGAAPTILTGQTIGTSYANSTDNCGLIIVNRALTGQETADLTAWLTAKGATS